MGRHLLAAPAIRGETAVIAYLMSAAVAVRMRMAVALAVAAAVIVIMIMQAGAEELLADPMYTTPVDEYEDMTTEPADGQQGGIVFDLMPITTTAAMAEQWVMTTEPPALAAAEGDSSETSVATPPLQQRGEAKSMGSVFNSSISSIAVIDGAMVRPSAFSGGCQQRVLKLSAPVAAMVTICVLAIACSRITQSY